MLQNVSMGCITFRAILQVPFLIIPVIWMSVAHAELGGDAASIVADGAQLHGVMQTSNAAPVAVVTITADNGITVREFLDSTGLVFAVSWSGPAIPDLRELLGRYYVRYTSALSALPNAGRQRAIHVAMADLVVQSGGHLRAYSGLAYLPARLPAGVAPETLRQAGMTN
jgi:hypothetical protein